MKLKDNNIRKSIKSKAIEEPKGLFAKTLLFLLLIISIINFGIICLVRSSDYQIDNNLINLVTFIIVSPLYLNFIKMFLNNSHDELIYFSDLFKIKKYSFKFFWYFIIISLSFYITSKIIITIPIIGLIINLILLVIFIPIFFVIPYLFAENTNTSLKELIINSFKLVHKKRIEFYGLLISFIPWFMLGILTFGILYLWLIPYTYITFTYYYLYLKKEIKLKKQNTLSNQFLITIFIVIIVLFIQPYNSIGINKYNSSLSYGNYKIKYNVPKDYKLSIDTEKTKTYTKDGNILQYSIYLSNVSDIIKMDKKIVKEYKDKKEYKLVTSSDFKIKINNKTLKGFKYSLIKENSKINNIIIYYPKDKFVITISFMSPNSINNKEIKKLVNID